MYVLSRWVKPFSTHHQRMTYSAPQQPQQAPASFGTVALFPFQPRQGEQVKPNQPAMTGTVQVTFAQLQELFAWSQTQRPDNYGRLTLRCSVWNTVSKDGQKNYLKGSFKPALESPQSYPPAYATQPAPYQPAPYRPSPQPAPQPPMQPAPVQQAIAYGDPAPQGDNVPF